MQRDGKMRGATPHSERAGEAILATGERVTLYRALRELFCSRCGGVIREDDLFIREEEPASGLPLLRICRGCAPLSKGSGLMDALLSPGDREESPPNPAPGDARGKVMSRLGPALELSRRRR